MSNGITAWSHSRWACYETCPLQFKLKYIDKLDKDLPTPPAFDRGRKVHKAAENYLLGKTNEVPKDFVEHFERQMKELRDLPEKVVEQQWGFTASYKPTSWFGNQTWWRAVLDVAVLYEDDTGDIIDHKTGKKYGSNKDQMELFAVAAFSQFPVLEHVTTRLWYVDSGDEDIEEFVKRDSETLKHKWTKKVQPMFNDTMFAPRPNEKCRFCDFSASKLGHCKFG